MYQAIAQTYRLLAAESTNLVSLVVQGYEQIARSLYEAARAIESRSIEKKTDDLNHAIQLISHLQATLDQEAGPEVARNLGGFYEVMRREIVQASSALSPEKLRQVAEHFLSVREAWQQVEQSVNLPQPHSAARTASPPPPPGFFAEEAPSHWSA